MGPDSIGLAMGFKTRPDFQCKFHNSLTTCNLNKIVYSGNVFKVKTTFSGPSEDCPLNKGNHHSFFRTISLETFD